jgi:hypothetical protein
MYSMKRMLAAGLWAVGDLPYLSIIWVVYGVFFPEGNMVLVFLFVRGVAIFTLRNASIWVFAAAVFFSSIAVYMAPFFISTAPLLVGIRDGSVGDINAHWWLGAIAASISTLGLTVARAVAARLVKHRQSERPM